jgi:DNA-binding MarR family transcriptional regulator
MSVEKISSNLLEVIPLIMRAIRSEMRGLAQPELSVAQFRVLARLEYKPHSNKDLAEWAGVAKATMSRTIDILVTRELVKRTLTVHDRREVILSLTPKGIRKFKSIENETKKRLNLILNCQSSANRKKLDEGLTILKEVFGSEKKIFPY